MKVGRNLALRRIAILKYFQQNGRAMVEDLAGRFSTTSQTIRKDLSVLADDSKVMRFHGGVALLAGIEYTGFEARKAIAHN